MKIGVGSKNPVKIKSVESVVSRIWPLATVLRAEVETGVSAMPMSDTECIEGARGRAHQSLKKLQADLAIGLEGGVTPLPQFYVAAMDGIEFFLTGWVVVVDRMGRENTASSVHMALPPSICSELKQGKELGPLMDELTGRFQTNHAEGAIGILTKKLMTRQASFEAAVAYALAPWLYPEWYELEA